MSHRRQVLDSHLVTVHRAITNASQEISARQFKFLVIGLWFPYLAA
jgi:hypothetical protein